MYHFDSTTYSTDRLTARPADDLDALQGLDLGGRGAIVGVAVAQLTRLVAAPGEDAAVLGDDHAVRRSAAPADGRYGHVDEGADAGGHEDVGELRLVAGHPRLYLAAHVLPVGHAAEEHLAGLGRIRHGGNWDVFLGFPLQVFNFFNLQPDSSFFT